jgi:transcriptional regulator with GAF, ATPase, and Fis domain
MPDYMTDGSAVTTDHYKYLNVYDSERRNCDHIDEWLPIDWLASGAEHFAGMVVQSESMRKLVNDIIRVAPYRVPILIQGDSGTGKELVAAALHRLGPAPLGPFVTFNCANLVESLVEAQLFGHVAGAFTDTREDSRGYFRSANGGTLLLDEVGELPLALQPRLLRALESHEVQPVGSTKSFKTNVRIVAATNRDLIAMIKAGQFRDELYYRLHGASIYIPPLRSRREAVGALTAHFVECYNRLFDKQVHLISCRGLDLLESFAWPGNVRELANAIRGAVMLTARDRLCVSDFPGLILDGTPPPTRSAAPVSAIPPDANSVAATTRPGPIHLATRNSLIRTLRETGGNCSRAAELLGLSRNTVYRLIACHGLARTGGLSQAEQSV